MEVKIGCDIVDISRITTLDALSQQKIFHPSELKHKQPETLAGIFAAKESCKKVFPELSWHDIEITHQRNGKPQLTINIAKKIISADVSISHDGAYAMATVVFLMEHA